MEIYIDNIIVVAIAAIDTHPIKILELITGKKIGINTSVSIVR